MRIDGVRTLTSVLLAFASPVAAQTNYKALLESKLDPVINQTMREWQIPGFVVGVVKNGTLVYAKGFGVARLGVNRPVTSQSLFHMASVTKPFVATAIMQLVEQGKVSLDGKVTEYLPYFRMADVFAEAITIRQLLNHTAGMPDVTDYQWNQPEYDDGALERYVRALRDSSLIAEPGAKFQYSNIGFEVLADVVAKMSGESFENYVKRRILIPLGMLKSTLLNRETSPELLTSPHVRNPQGTVQVSAVFPYNRPHAGSSTLYSNVDEMARWALANLNRGELDGRRILKASSYDQLWTPTFDLPATADAPTRKIGLSWFLSEHRGHRTIGHGGGDTGFRSFIVLLPDDSLGVVAMGNYDRTPIAGVVDAALDVMLGLEPSVPEPPK